MTEEENRRLKELGLPAVALLILGGILVAGLWPFHSPRNEVTWLEGRNGLRFGEYGTILSSGIFKATTAQGAGPLSLEIWLQTGSVYHSCSILTFYVPGSLRQFSLHQFMGALSLESDSREHWDRTRTAGLYLDDVFAKRKPVFITITANGRQTSVYSNGILVRRSSQFQLSRSDFRGELVIGNSPVRPVDGWSGQLLGLALYNQELTPAQVLRHCRTWTENGRPAPAEDERTIALYLFDEHAGNNIHSQVQAGVDLNIPERYVILDKVFLERPWKEFRPNLSYLKDILINVAGFIPLGFFTCAYLSSVHWVKRAALVTILLGCAVSLTIEILQAYLPTRYSGTTDIFTNTLGTCLGAILYERMAGRRSLRASSKIALGQPR